jgi:hypothetical protein
LLVHAAAGVDIREMLWAKLVIAGGMILLVAGWGLGTEPRSASVDDVTHGCGAAIPDSWLVPGTASGPASQARAATAEKLRAESACAAAIQRTRVLTWTMFGVGILLIAAGSTALRERGRPMTSRLAPARV